MKLMRNTVLMIAIMTSAAFGGVSEGWFDLENCGMCKHLSDDMELLNAMQWENHVLSNGMIEITAVPEAYGKRFKALMGKMEAAGAKMMAGEQVELCNFCNSYGGLMMAGAKMDQVEAKAGYVNVITSDDPKVVAMIHDHAKQTIAAYAEMVGEHGHADAHGHDHDHPHGH